MGSILIGAVIITAAIIAAISLLSLLVQALRKDGLGKFSEDDIESETDNAKTTKPAKEPAPVFVKLSKPEYSLYGDRYNLSWECNFDIFYHVKTRVMYAVSCGTYTYGVVTPLLNPDGTPMLYEPDEEEI